MKVRVRLRREGGAHRQPYGLGHTSAGDLHLTHREGASGKVPMLQLLAAEVSPWPNLYEPRLVGLSAKEFSFVGFEKSGTAWVMQQWDCELL